jgi:hypothetical protein
MSTRILSDLGLDRHPRVLMNPPAGSERDPNLVISENPATGKPIAAVRLGSSRWLKVMAPA